MKKVILIILFFLLLTSYAEEGCSSVSLRFTETKNFYHGVVPSFRYSRYENIPYLDNVQTGIYITVDDNKNNVRAEAFLPEKGTFMDIYMYPYVGEFGGYEAFYNCIQPHVMSNKKMFLEKCFIRNISITDIGLLKSSIEKLQGDLSCYSKCNQSYDIVVRQVTPMGYKENSLSSVSCMSSIFDNDEFFEPYRIVDSLVRNLFFSKIDQCGWEKLGFAKDCLLP